jgi:sugar/nucleoside kinase (ribokinase family)
MPEREEIARSTAAKLAAADVGGVRAVMGFDGFVDEIIDVVDKRQSHDRYERMATIAQFAQKISAAAGQSCNFELVTVYRKLGGNGPIMANALATAGVGVTYVGTLGSAPEAGGEGGVDAVFADFASRATLLPMAPPAHTSALEFSDGKLMLGNLAPLSQVTWERLVELFGLERLRRMFDEATLVGMLNWTMLPHLTDIWEQAAEHLFPFLTNKPRRFFADLADPQKRTEADLRAAMAVLTRIDTGKQRRALPVTLGLNLAEAQQVAKVMGIAAEEIRRSTAGDVAGLGGLAASIREALGIDTVVIHPRAGAAAATAAGEEAAFNGPFTSSPRISTGAGDHFNAGFLLGQLLAFSLEEALCLGTATSGYYVRHAASPTKMELANFMETLPAPQEG